MPLPNRQSLRFFQRATALLCVMVILFLDMLAAAPQWHEAICHHHHHACCPCDASESTGQEHDEDSGSCEGCVISQFASGHVTPLMEVDLGGVFTALLPEGVLPVFPIAAGCERPRHLWPHSCAPPATVAIRVFRGLTRAA